MKQQAGKQYNAIVLGGTGGVGAFLVEKLLACSRCEQVTVISRKELPAQVGLKVEVREDFSRALSGERDQIGEVFTGNDVVFCCLGAPEKALIGLMYNPWKYEKMFQEVDYDYVMGFAAAAQSAGVPHFSVISSPSADLKAKFSYSRIKGEMERDLKQIEFSRISIFQPYHLMKVARGHESKWKKRLKNFIALIASIMPAKQKAILVEDVALAMKNEYERGPLEIDERVKYYHADDMRALVATELT